MFAQVRYRQLVLRDGFRSTVFQLDPFIVVLYKYREQSIKGLIADGIQGLL